MKLFLALLTSLGILLLGCGHSKKVPGPEAYPFHFQGLLQKQGITAYQYGTHVISQGTENYALRSSTVNLDGYVGKTVTIQGSKIEGYPLEGGPAFIDVKAVR